MTKRQQVLQFARMHRMTAKGGRACGQPIVTLYRERTKGQWQDAWVDAFNNWTEAYEFLLGLVKKREAGEIPCMPWERAA